MFDKDLWDEMIEFIADSVVRLEKVFKPSIKVIGEQLKHYKSSHDEEI